MFLLVVFLHHVSCDDECIVREHLPERGKVFLAIGSAEVFHIFQNLHAPLGFYHILALPEGGRRVHVECKAEVGNFARVVELHASHLQLLRIEGFVVGFHNVCNVLYEHATLHGQSLFHHLFIVAIEVHVAPDVDEHALGIVVHGHVGEVEVAFLLVCGIDFGEQLAQVVLHGLQQGLVVVTALLCGDGYVHGTCFACKGSEQHAEC